MCERVVNRINTAVVSFLVADFVTLADGVVARDAKFTFQRSDERAEELDDESVAVFVKVEAKEPATRVEKTIGRTPFSLPTSLILKAAALAFSSVFTKGMR